MCSGIPGADVMQLKANNFSNAIHALPSKHHVITKLRCLPNNQRLRQSKQKAFCKTKLLASTSNKRIYWVFSWNGFSERVIMTWFLNHTKVRKTSGGTGLETGFSCRVSEYACQKVSNTLLQMPPFASHDISPQANLCPRSSASLLFLPSFLRHS